MFGELYYKFLDKFTLTLGAREYWLKQTTDFTADGFLNFGPTPSDPQEQQARTGVNPKVGLSYQATEATMVYASASKGFRAGRRPGELSILLPGPTLPVTDITQLKSDTLWSYEVGSKVQLRDPGICFRRRPSTLTGTICNSRWRCLAAPI